MMAGNMENLQCLRPGIFYGQENDADALSELLKVTDTLFQGSVRITADVGAAKQAQLHRPKPEGAWSRVPQCYNQRPSNYDYNMWNQQSRISGYAPYHNADFQNNGQGLSNCGVNVGFHRSPPPGLAPPMHHQQTHGAAWKEQPQNNYNMTWKHYRPSSDGICGAFAQAQAMNSSHGHHGSHHGSHTGSQYSRCGYAYEQTWSTAYSHMDKFDIRSSEGSYDSKMYTENDFNNIDSDSDADMDPLMAVDFARRSGYDDDVEVEVILGPTQMIGSPASLDELVLPPAGCGVNLEKGVDATQGRKLRSSNSACALSDIIWLSDIAEFDLGRTKETPISFGSIVHLSSSYSHNCRPCIFEKRIGRCVRGKGCEFCHLHAGQKYRPLTSGKSDRRMGHHSSPGSSRENSLTGYQSNGHLHSHQGSFRASSWQGSYTNAAVHSNQSARFVGF